MRFTSVFAFTCGTAALLLSGCSGGSKELVLNNYRLDLSWTQDRAGGVVITGTTDLPEGTEIDAVVTTEKDPKNAIVGAVLNGSTRSPGSLPVKKPKGEDLGKFTLVANNPLAETCHRQPPCGPFPAGTYYVVVDAKTPHESTQDITVDNDPRYIPVTHGYSGFPGIEVVLTASLGKIAIHLDEEGRPVNPALAPEESPADGPTPSAQVSSRP